MPTTATRPLRGNSSRFSTSTGDLAGAHANLGVARYLLADYNRAVSAFRRALELDPSMRNAELYLGLSEAKSRRRGRCAAVAYKGILEC